jgi:hypothetical protein
MSDLSSFSSAAKGFTKNPLGIIALFIVLVYGFASLTLGVTAKLEAAERMLLVEFLVTFPFAVLVLFGWLVSKHHNHLYSPGDFRSDESFHRQKEIAERRVAEATADRERIKVNIQETIRETSSSDDGDSGLWRKITDQVMASVDRSTNITVDARDFLGDPSAVFTFPAAAFEALGDLTNAVYFKLSKKIRPYQYGHTWVLRDKQNGTVVETLRMLSGAPSGQPLPDSRPLSEAGIFPGMTLVAERVGNASQ